MNFASLFCVRTFKKHEKHFPSDKHASVSYFFYLFWFWVWHPLLPLLTTQALCRTSALQSKTLKLNLHVLFVNGKFCKDPKYVTANDFFFSGLDKPGNTSNRVGSNVTQLNVDKIPGLNTLGISLARIDYAPYGLNPPHTHPRGTEILVVVEGTVEVGFVTSNQQDGSNKLFTKILNKGDVFVFPIGLIHFQFNRGHTNAVAFAAGLSSQNAGVITIANAVFDSDPRINPDVLTKAFQVDKNVIDYLQKQFWVDNNN
ncbi:hypothetical protein FEM48_Zijuj02G0176900 [Ziziphus jujuba var. spinosa]|uniref:Germin-like protein n=1 Tax=Ziziphus jujuba var. spinosa TaxID=714518 RepID=A0A978VX24_ZIZJJ|nr:hypothetical protein FEM48_Zijuj02G0176900 [Ziziphus jujuba var. spinosa]